MAPQTAPQDEFEQQAAAEAALSGYEHTRDTDVEDQREYTIIPKGTAIRAIVAKFTLDETKNHAPFIAGKVKVRAPETYADGASNFTDRLWLSAAVKEGKSQSGWDGTVRTLCYMYASAAQCGVKEAKAAVIDPVYAQFPNIGPDDVIPFREALVAHLNEVLAGEEFGVTMNVEPAVQDTNADGTPKVDPETGEPVIKYPAKQKFGNFDYPKPVKA